MINKNEINLPPMVNILKSRLPKEQQPTKHSATSEIMDYVVILILFIVIWLAVIAL